MKTRRELLFCLGGFGLILALVGSYFTPVGRRASLAAIRVAHLAANATGISPRPSLMLRIWGEPPASGFGVEVYASGRFVVAAQGRRAERRLEREVADAIVATGRAALGDFGSEGCAATRPSMKADLYLMVDGRWMGSVCRNAVDWPQGPHTRHLLEKINEQLPAGMPLPVRF